MNYFEKFKTAHEAGKAAVVKANFQSDGPSGFGWVSIKKANSPFAKWLKLHNFARASHTIEVDGVDILIANFDNSLQKKAVYAEAFALYLRDNHNIQASAESMSI